jgi:diguanylate cyclase
VNYSDSVERSTDYLRQALPLMSKQAAALHPISYAVWYDYVAKRSPALRTEVDAHLAKHGQLDEASTEALFRKHIAEIDPRDAQKVADGFQRILSGMASSAAEAGDQTARYGDKLARLNDILTAEDPQQTAQTPEAVADILQGTLEMNAAMVSLQRSLESSQREINVLREEVLRARNDSLVDSLTGLANRRAFDQQLAVCLASAQMAPQGAPKLAPLLVTTDIDHFKRINDTYGHGFGDQVLRAVAQVLKACAGKDVMAARVGGEEFAILLPGGMLAEATTLAEKIRSAVSRCRIRRQGVDETLANVTVSLGVTAYQIGEEVREFIDRADRALYASKTAGRNRVTVMPA